MAGQKSLVKSLDVGESGRLHRCRSNAKHSLPKGAVMLIVKEGQDARHYCADCGMKFIRTAHDALSQLEGRLKGRTR